jgi:hypothetical protein
MRNRLEQNLTRSAPDYHCLLLSFILRRRDR